MSIGKGCDYPSWAKGVALLVLAGSLLTSCASLDRTASIDLQRTLAPSGTLRIGLYPGTPTSIIPGTSGAPPRGVGHDLGIEMARRLGVQHELVVFSKNAEVLDAVKTGKVDVAFTNASASRARDMDFTEPYLEIELGYLVPRESAISNLTGVDQSGIRVGVTENSSSDSALSRDLRNAKVVRSPTVKQGIELMASGRIDAYATNKATLFEMADELPGAKVLEERWGVERHALAIPKGREQGLPFARQFAAQVRADGFVRAAAARAGLRGMTDSP